MTTATCTCTEFDCECPCCYTKQAKQTPPPPRTFSRIDCDIVAYSIKRTQPDADLILHMLGLVEQPGLNTRKDSSSEPVPVTRKPLWEEPVVGKLSTGHMQGGNR